MEIIIQANRKWWKPQFRDLWQYRDLMTLLVYRDFVARYKQTILGPLWFIIQPLTTTLVFTVIFGNVAQIPTDGIPPVLFYLGGLLGWNYFAQNLGATSNTFLANQHLYGKVYFPRLVSPLATSIVNLLAFGIQFIVFLGFFLWFRFFTETPLPHWSGFLFIPLFLFHTFLLSLGLGLWISSLTAKYRDFGFLMGFLTQIWMYATPIVYPLSQVPDRWKWVASLNPMTQVIEGYKTFLLGAGSFDWHSYSLSFLMSILFFYSGILIFQKTERNFVDTV